MTRWFFLLCLGVAACTPNFDRSEVASGVYGRVVHGGTERAVVGATCVLEPTGQVAESIGDGSFSFLDLAAGAYFVICRYDDGGQALAVIAGATVTEGASVELGSLSLEATGAIAGTVQLQNAAEHAGVSVFIPGTTLEANSATDGTFTFDDLPASRFDLRLERNGYLPMTVSDVEVPAGETVQLDVVLLAINTGVTGSVLLAGGTSVSTTRSVDVTVTATNDAAEMLISDDPSFANATRQGVSEPLTWDFDSEGEVTLYVRFLNVDGVDGTVVSDSIIIDTEGPSGSVSIEPAGASTNLRDVTLTVAGSDTTGVADARVSNRDDFAGADWMPFAATLPWTLSLGDGVKNVYVQLRDPQGLAGDVFFDTIELDTQAPSPAVITFPQGSVAASTDIEIELGGPPASGMILSEGAMVWSSHTVVPYARRFVWSLSSGVDGPRTLSLALVDAAGNISVEATAQVEIDTTPPTTPVIDAPIAGAVTASNDYVITLLTPSSDTHFAGYELIGGGNTDYATWTVAPDSADLRVQLLADGTYSLGVRGVDAAGNSSATAWVVVERDTTPPVVSRDLRLLSVAAGAPNINVMKMTTSSNETGVSCTLQYTHGGGTPQNIGLAPSATFSVPEQTLVSYQLGCTDAAGNTGIDSFDESSGTGVTVNISPASPWTAAASPYWVADAVEVNGPLVVEPGAEVRRGAQPGDASLGGITTLTADSAGGATVRFEGVSLAVAAAAFSGVEITGGTSSVNGDIQIGDSIFIGHDLSPARATTASAVVERNVFVDCDLNFVLVAPLVLDFSNNWVGGTSHVSIQWPTTSSVTLTNNSFAEPGQTVVQLLGPTGSGPGATDLTITGNYWGTQDPIVVDPMISLVAGGFFYSGLELVDSSGGLPSTGHSSTPTWP